MATYLNTRLEDLYKQYNGAPDTLPNLNEKNVDAQTFYHSQALELAISPIKSQLPNIVFLYFTGLNGLFGNIMLLYTGFGISKRCGSRADSFWSSNDKANKPTNCLD